MSKKNVVLRAALQYIFKNKPKLKDKPASLILSHIKTAYPDRNPLKMAKGHERHGPFRDKCGPGRVAGNGDEDEVLVTWTPLSD